MATLTRTLLATLVVAVTASSLSAQVGIYNADSNRYPYSPFWSVGMIFSQNDRIRAQAEAAVDYQTARQIAAEAYSQELDNELKRVEIYFEKRARRDAEVLKNHLDEADKRKAAALRRLVDHPELTGEGLVNGKALNTLKEALRSSVLSFDYLNDDPDVDALIAQFQLTPEMLSAINLQMTNVRGESGVFGADTGQLRSFQWWPHLLRSEQFKLEREAIDMQLAKIRQLASNQSNIPTEEIDELEQMVLGMGDMFLSEVDGQAMARESVAQYFVYRESEQHLQSLLHAVQRLKDVGRQDGALIVNGYNPAVDGKNLATLLAFMVRNGVEFAPAEKGEENVYHELFEMAKSLYVATSN